LRGRHGQEPSGQRPGHAAQAARARTAPAGDGGRPMKRYDELWLHSEPVEQDRIRELLGDALGTEPDMRLDPDALLTQAQRRDRRGGGGSGRGGAAAVAAAPGGLALVTSSAGSAPPQGPSPHLVRGASSEQEPARSS